MRKQVSSAPKKLKCGKMHEQKRHTSARTPFPEITKASFFTHIHAFSSPFLAEVPFEIISFRQFQINHSLGGRILRKERSRLSPQSRFFSIILGRVKQARAEKGGARAIAS